MPIRPVPPRAGKTPVWYGRGRHLGRHVNRSTGARDGRLARRIIRQWESEIERGVFAEAGEPTFASAALDYMKAGGERRYLAPLLRHFQTTPLKEIGQAAIDAAAHALYPGRSAATLNRQVYTPVQAILRRAGIEQILRRPKGHAGRQVHAWLWPEQARALLEQCTALDAEFGILCMVLLATGMRLTDGLTLAVDRLRLSEAYAFLPETKNGEPRPVHLPPAAVAALARHPRGLDRPGESVFRFHKSGHIYSLLRAASFKAGVNLPERCAFHIFCHTYGTWMRRYAGADELALLGTRRWKNEKSVRRYTHTIVSEEARRADLLPVVGGETVDSSLRDRKAKRHQ